MRTAALLCVLAIGCGHRTEPGGSGAVADNVAASGAVSAKSTPSAATAEPIAAEPLQSGIPVKSIHPMPEVAVVVPGRLHVKGAEYEGVIADGGDWTPSPRDVADVEAVLGPALGAHDLGKHQPARELKREYRGTTLEGKKGVDVQLSCKAPGWPADPLPSVKGGGACYGRARYDVATGKITDLWANSPK